MANTDSPFGFKPVGHLQGLDWSEKVRWYFVPATDGTAIGLYDLVIPVNTGAEAIGEFPICAQATAGSTVLLGSAVAFRTDPPSTPRGLQGDNTIPRYTYRPASTAMYVGVTDDPYIIYEAQEDSVGSNLAAADVGTNCDIIVATADATTGLSQMEIDSSTTTPSTANVRILGLAPANAQVGLTNAIGTNAKWRVLINEHFFKGTAGL